MPPGITRLRLLFPILTLFAVACLAGCGQKGPLYLPDEARAVPVSPDTTA